MLLPSHNPSCIPQEISRVAHAAYPQGALAIRLRDALGGI